MNKVLVTGASGYLGRHIPDHILQAGGSVSVLGRSPWHQQRDNVDFHKVDLMNIDRNAFGDIAAIGADTLIHVAWYTEPGAYWNSIENLRWMSASLRLIDAFIAGGGKRIVVAGTCAEYDWRYHTMIEGETPLNPSTLYGQSKASLNLTLQALARTNAVSVAWAHIFFPYGPHEKSGRMMSDLVLNLLQGREMAVSPGHVLRDFMHIDDVAGGIAALARSDVQGQINIGSGKPLRQRDVMQLAAEKTGRPELLKFTRPPSPSDPVCLAAATKRLEIEVGYTPRFDIDTGLTHTVEWARNELS